MQTELRISRAGKHLDDTRITVISDKQKDDEEADDLVFALEQQVIDGMCKEDGSPVTSVVLVPSEPLDDEGPEQGKPMRLGREERVHAVLLACRSTGARPMTVNEIGDALAGQPEGPLKQRTVQDALKKLSQKGVAEVAGTSGFAQTWRLVAQLPESEADGYAQDAL